MQHRQLGQTGETVPAVGLGTWAIVGGDPNPTRDREAVNSLKLGLSLGMTLIDTAEMYSAGRSEKIVGLALKEPVAKTFVASKVSPNHFAYDDVLHSADMSLKRLGLRQIDLYQLHWPNPRIPIAETMRAMEKLVSDGKIRHIGVSNFSVQQTREAQQSLSRERIVSNQVEYNLLEQSIEKATLPYCAKEGITIIAYSPLAQGRIPRGRGGPFKVLDEIAKRAGKSRNQVALNWLLRTENVVIIPKAVKTEHVREDAEVSDWKFSREDYELLSRAFM